MNFLKIGVSAMAVCIGTIIFLSFLTVFIETELGKPVEVGTPITESEYSCPDLNSDGIVNIYDVTMVSAKLNSCQGDSNYNPKGDVDGDGCLTNTDLNFVQKYYGQKTAEISQCQGVVTPPTKPESEYSCPDLNSDGIVNIYDVTMISAKLNSCQGDSNYDPKGDVDGDGCLTNTDLSFVQKYYGQKTAEVSQCQGVVTLESIEQMISSIADEISKIAERIKALQQ